MGVPLTEPDKGWAWVVMLASFCNCMVIGFLTYAVGFFNVVMLEEFDGEVSKVSLASGIFLGFFNLSALLVGMIIDKWSCRVAMVLGSVVLTTGLAMTAFVTNVEYLILSFGIVAGSGAGLCAMTSFVVLGMNFKKKTNLACGVVATGLGVGSFLLPMLMPLVKDYYGYSGIWLICAGISFHICFFGFLIRPSRLERERNLEKKLEGNKNICQHFKHFFGILSNKQFLCVVFAMGMGGFGVNLMYVNISSYAILLGSSESDSSFLLSVAGLSTTISRILLGCMGNSGNIDELLLFSGNFGILGVISIIYPIIAGSFSGQVFFAICLGFYGQACFVVLNAINIKLVGIRHLPNSFGLSKFSQGIGSILGSPLTGVLYDATSSYSVIYVIAGAAFIIACMLGFAVVLFDGGKVSHHTAHTKINKTQIVPHTMKENSIILNTRISCQNDIIQVTHM